MTTTNFTDKLINSAATGRAPSLDLADALYAKFGEGQRFHAADLRLIVLHPEQYDDPEDDAIRLALNPSLVGVPCDDMKNLGVVIGVKLSDLSKRLSGGYTVEKVPGPKPSNKQYWWVKKLGF